MPSYDQQEFHIRCEWGMQGLLKLAPARVVVIVDVFSFCTTVDIALGRGVTVFPYPTGDEGVTEYARARNALVAGKRIGEAGAMTLSPSSMVAAQPGTRLVLPSRNGSAMAFRARDSGAVVLAGSLRNASAVASWVNRAGGPVAVVPGGERWPHDGTLRPAFEDMLGAGAIVRKLSGTCSPETRAMAAVFESTVASGLQGALRACSSSRELIESGFESDVALASELDASEVVALLDGNTFVDARSR